MVEHKYAVDWFFEQMAVPMFGQADALALGDGVLRKDTFQNWINRGLVKSKTVRGKRLLTPFHLAEMIFSQMFVRDLEVTPSAARLMVASCLLIVQREQRKHPVKSADALLVFKTPTDLPKLAYRGRDLDGMFDDLKPYIVIPFGRMLETLAAAAKQHVEGRPA